MVQAPSKSLTLEAFLALPETKPASEYINGEIIQKPMPKGKHSRLQGKLETAINDALEAQKIACAFTELRCTFGDRSIVPDVSVFTWERIPFDADGDIADDFESCPDWIIEVLSPGQSWTKLTSKILHALNNGAQMGWIIDPKARSIVVYPAGQQLQLFDSDNASENLPGPAFAQSLFLTHGDIFSWLKL